MHCAGARQRAAGREEVSARCVCVRKISSAVAPQRVRCRARRRAAGCARLDAQLLQAAHERPVLARLARDDDGAAGERRVRAVVVRATKAGHTRKRKARDCAASCQRHWRRSNHTRGVVQGRGRAHLALAAAQRRSGAARRRGVAATADDARRQLQHAAAPRRCTAVQRRDACSVAAAARGCGCGASPRAAAATPASALRAHAPRSASIATCVCGTPPVLHATRTLHHHTHARTHAAAKGVCDQAFRPATQDSG
jgi:hypothetical protein